MGSSYTRVVERSRSRVEVALALAELGRFEAAEGVLAGEDAGAPRTAVAIARVAAARGELMRALEALEGEAEELVPERARLLSILGRPSQALDLLEGREGGAAALLRARIHLDAGEPAAASVSLPGDLEKPPGDDPLSLARHSGELGELELARGEILLQSDEPGRALEALGRARRRAASCGSARLLSRAWSCQAEARAFLGHRWRALRCASHAVDLVAQGRVPSWLAPGVQLRASRVFGVYGHRDLAERAIQGAHQLVLQLASGIEERAYRETFLIDNRDCQQVIGLWKGEVAWGLDLSRG